jgi:hypothetical protein
MRKNKKNTNVEGRWKLELIFSFMEKTHEPLHLSKWSLISKVLWIYLQILFKSLFCLTKLLIMEILRNFEFVLGQTLNRST